jgi:hypothetical protein
LLTRIPSPEEERERASKVLRLNGGTEYGPKLLSASAKPKPTVRIKRGLSSSKLKGGSIIPGHGTLGNQSFQEHIATCEICRAVHERQTGREKEKAERALRLNGIITETCIV